MKFPEEDRQFLLTPSKWSFDEWGRQRVCVKTYGKGPQRCGVIFVTEPLTVFVTFIVGPGPTKEEIVEAFATIDDLLKVWMVD